MNTQTETSQEFMLSQVLELLTGKIIMPPPDCSGTGNFVGLVGFMVQRRIDHFDLDMEIIDRCRQALREQALRDPETAWLAELQAPTNAELQALPGGIQSWYRSLLHEHGAKFTVSVI